MMDILLNELSLHGQFDTIEDFKKSITIVMLAREKLKQFDRELHCYRNLMQAQVGNDFNLQQAINRFDTNKKRAILSWLTQKGPFWDDSRAHDANEYIEYNNQIVTDFSLGEAAYRCAIGSECHIFSFQSLNWQLTPVDVIWCHDKNSIVNVPVTNHWEIHNLELALNQKSKPIQSWRQLADIVPRRCINLIFSPNSFEYLYSHPFVDSAAKRIVELLIFLDKFKICFDEQGKRTDEGNRLYQDHFTGDKAWFTDSSNDEKSNFKNELTFNHPTKNNEELFCSWHGKIKTPQFRIHFSWPVCADAPLYIPYIGPKITKK